MASLSDSYQNSKPVIFLDQSPKLRNQPPSFSYSQEMPHKFSPPRQKIEFDPPFRSDEKNFRDPFHNGTPNTSNNYSNYEKPYEFYEIPKKSQFSPPENNNFPNYDKNGYNNNNYPNNGNPFPAYEIPKELNYVPPVHFDNYNKNVPNYEKPSNFFENPGYNYGQPMTFQEIPPDYHYTVAPERKPQFLYNDIPITNHENREIPKKSNFSSPNQSENPQKTTDSPIIRLEYPIDHPQPSLFTLQNLKPTEYYIPSEQSRLSDPPMIEKIKKHENPIKTNENSTVIRLEYPMENLRTSDYLANPVILTHEDRPFSKLDEMDRKCEEMNGEVQELKNSLQGRLMMEQELEERNQELEEKLERLRKEKAKKAHISNDKEEIDRLHTQLNILREELEKERLEPKQNTHLIRELYEKLCGLKTNIWEMERKTHEIEEDVIRYRTERKNTKERRLHLLNSMIGNLRDANCWKCA